MRELLLDGLLGHPVQDGGYAVRLQLAQVLLDTGVG